MNKPTNIYNTLASSYSEVQLQNIINNPEDYAKAQVAACIAELDSRGVSVEKIEPIKDGERQALVFQVKNKLSNDVPVADCKKYLEEKGLHENQINDIINLAIKKHVPPIESPYSKKEHYGVRLGAGLFIVFLIIKLLLRMMSN